MSGMRVFECSIEEILTLHPDLYLEHCAVMAVALMGRHAAPPCDFLVDCQGFQPARIDNPSRFLLRVGWDEQTAVTAARVWLSEQPKPIVERAALALAALTFGRLIPSGQMRVAEHGQRIDYWLPRLKCALEVSGTQHAKELDRRHRQKTAQVLGNPWGWNGYVFVCCFSEARRMIRWSYHAMEENAHESS